MFALTSESVVSWGLTGPRGQGAALDGVEGVGALRNHPLPGATRLPQTMRRPGLSYPIDPQLRSFLGPYRAS